MSSRRGKPFHRRWHGDALGGYELLSLELRGAYTTLLDQMYDRGGPVRDDPHHVCGWLRCDVRVWRRIRAALVDQHKKLQAYTDQNGVAWLVNDRAQRELGLPTYAELVANLSPKFPIAIAELTPKSDEKPQEINETGTENAPLARARLPLPLPYPPIAPQGAVSPTVLGPDVQTRKREYPAEFETAWKAYPHHPGRSSKPDAMAEWKRLPPGERAELADCIAEFTPNVASVCGGKGAPCMARWLKHGKHLNWALPSGQSSATPISSNPTDVWRRRIETFRQNQHWDRTEWGPAPGKPGCKAPVEILAACGFGGEGVLPFARRSDAA